MHCKTIKIHAKILVQVEVQENTNKISEKQFITNLPLQHTLHLAKYFTHIKNNRIHSSSVTLPQ
jgi:hypothetical protein